VIARAAGRDGARAVPEAALKRTAKMKKARLKRFIENFSCLSVAKKI
jgi:hypothetical protein